MKKQKISIPFKQKISTFINSIRLWFLFTCLFTLFFISVIALRNTILNTNVKEIKFAYNGTKIPQEEIKQRLDVSADNSVFGYDIVSAHENVKKIPYVRELKIQRKFPDSITVYIEEKKEIATFFEDGIYYPLDTEGEIILQKFDEENLPPYMIIEGYGAPIHFLPIFNFLNKNKLLKDKFKKIIKVENRRFDLVMEDRKIIQLPAANPLHALEKLEQLQKNYDVLNKAFKKLDLRNIEKILIEL